MPELAIIEPDWDAPRSVRVAVSTRGGGVSTGPYAALNLGDHVGDDPAAVAPDHHIWTASRIAWFDTKDDLPRYPERGPASGS